MPLIPTASFGNVSAENLRYSKTVPYPACPEIRITAIRLLLISLSQSR